MGVALHQVSLEDVAQLVLYLDRPRLQLGGCLRVLGLECALRHGRKLPHQPSADARVPGDVGEAALGDVVVLQELSAAVEAILQGAVVADLLDELVDGHVAVCGEPSVAATAAKWPYGPVHRIVLAPPRRRSPLARMRMRLSTLRAASVQGGCASEPWYQVRLAITCMRPSGDGLHCFRNSRPMRAPKTLQPVARHPHADDRHTDLIQRSLGQKRHKHADAIPSSFFGLCRITQRTRGECL